MNVAFRNADECEFTGLRFKPKEFGLKIKEVIFFFIYETYAQW